MQIPSLVIGLALAFSVSPVFAQVRFTPPPPAPDPNPPRLQPSPSLTEDLRAIEAFSSLFKGKPAEERRHLYSAPPRHAREVSPPVPRASGPEYGRDQWQREYEAEMNRLNQEGARPSRRRAWDDLVEGRHADRWRQSYSAPEEEREWGVGRDDPLLEDFFERNNRIEPGHIPYPCDGITGNPRARRDCQESWQADNPNDRLWYD